jgi:hypothetical protein
MLKPGEKMIVKKNSSLLIEALSEAGVSIIYPN